QPRDRDRKGKTRAHDPEELVQLATEWLFRPSHLEHDGKAVNGVRRTETPDTNLRGNPGRPRIEKGTRRAPDLQPTAGDPIIVIILILWLGSPANSPIGGSLEHLLRNLTVVGESPIEILGKAVAQEGEHAPRVQGEHRAQGRGIPEREANPDASMVPPA